MAAFPMLTYFATRVFHKKGKFNSLQTAAEGSSAFEEERNGRGRLVRAVVLTA